MSVAFKDAPFKTAGGASARSLAQWFGDVVNVLEFAHLHTGSGVMGSGTGDDSPCFNAAFDKAFKTGGALNGFTNRHLNLPVLVPAGKYLLGTPLTLTKVVGGHIYGAGKQSTQIKYDVPGAGPLTALLNLNGCSDLRIEMMTLEYINHNLGGDNTCVIKLDWDADNSGNGCSGNHDNLFQEVAFGAGQFTIVIGSNAASQGHNNVFSNCTLNGSGTRSDVGIDVRGPNAVNNQITGGGEGNTYQVAFVRCPSGGGSIHAKGLSMAGNTTPVEFLMDSDKVMYIGQLRSENTKLLKMSNGVVTVQSATGTNGMVNAIEINGGTCILQGNDIHDSGQIIGTGGRLILSGNYWGTSTTPLSGYSGTVVVNEDGIT